jgi:hypothetical protein
VEVWRGLGAGKEGMGGDLEGSGDVVGAGCPGGGGFGVRTVHSTPLVEDRGKRRVTPTREEKRREEKSTPT